MTRRGPPHWWPVCGQLWPSRGQTLHLPLCVQWSEIRGVCAINWVKCILVFIPITEFQYFRGLGNTYSSAPVYWCSTKTDINGFHVRGSYLNPGVRHRQYHYMYMGKTWSYVSEICWILWWYVPQNIRKIFLAPLSYSWCHIMLCYHLYHTSYTMRNKRN